MLDLILQSGLASPIDLRDLTLEANLHLFQWTGRLVQGADIPYATHAQDVEEQKDIKDWRYLQLDSKPAPYVDRNKDFAPLPDRTIEQLREDLGLTPQATLTTYSDRSPYRPGFAREGQAQAFDARQNQNLTLSEGRDIPNPVLTQLGIEILGSAPADRPQETLGAWWVLKTLTVALLGFELLNPVRVHQFGPIGATRIAMVYLEENCSSDAIATEVKSFTSREFTQLERMAAVKLHQIEDEIYKWVAVGDRPICLADGSVDEVLTIAQATTALAGIYHLATLGAMVQDFIDSGRSVLLKIKSPI
jgi:hypothetical protein